MIDFGCHNDFEFNGDRSPDRLGYGYSWAFSIYNDEPSDEVDILSNMTNTSGLKRVQHRLRTSRFYEITRSFK
jgi:hypothetical protein